MTFWSGKRDSNPRPSAWEADALPTELLPHFAGKSINFYQLVLKLSYEKIPMGSIMLLISPLLALFDDALFRVITGIGDSLII